MPEPKGRNAASSFGSFKTNEHGIGSAASSAAFRTGGEQRLVNKK
jgi:hypothetical protein